MKAAVVQPDKTVKIQDKPVPIIRPNEILLNVKAIGLNPTDWKHIDLSYAKPGDISGCDFVGEVVEIGSAVPDGEVKKGELRWGYMRGGQSPHRGGFAEYVAVEWDISSVVPANITAQQAASFPIPLVTAIQGLYLRPQLPQPPQKANGEWILIWSGATSVGQYVIQLAKLSGLRVAATASPARWERLKALGADVLVDYKDPDVIQKLKDATNDSIQYGFDCIAEGDTYKQAARAFRPAGGHLLAVLFDLPGAPRPEVKTEAILAYTALGTDHSWGEHHFKTSAADRGLYAKWCKLTTELLRDGKIVPLEVDVIGGLDNIQKGLELLQSGKHSAKIVLNVP